MIATKYVRIDGELYVVRDTAPNILVNEGPDLNYGGATHTIDRWKQPAPATLPRLTTPEDDRPFLSARPLLSMGDVLLMGAIRHRQRKGFSSDVTPIDDARQLDWWKHNRHRVDGWLFDDIDGNTVGYGALLQRPDGRWVSSCAVLPEFTGHGYGRALLTWMVMQVEHEVYARAVGSNVAAVKLHDPLIWQTTGVDDLGCVHFRTWPKIRRAKLAVNLDHCGVLGQ